MPTTYFPAKDANNATQQIPVPPNNGRAAAENCRPVALSTEDKTVLDSLDSKLPTLINGKQPSEPLGALGTARTLAVTGTAATVALTTTCRRVSMVALTADLCLTVDGSTATTSSHYIQAGERIDLLLTAATTISAIRAGSTDGSLRISELV